MPQKICQESRVRRFLMNGRGIRKRALFFIGDQGILRDSRLSDRAAELFSGGRQNDLDAVAKMPTRDEAIAQLMGVMKAPIAKLVRVLAAPNSKLVRTLAAVRDQKQG